VKSSAGNAAGDAGGALNRGRFIVIEGGEGAGKSTQVRRVASFVRGRGLPVIETREPGGTEVGEEIRRVSLGPASSVPPSTELLLILAARAAFVRSVVRPALKSGTWVISDRFEMSTFAYQGYGRNVSLDSIRELNRFATGALKPDLCLVLELSAEEGQRRQAKAGKRPDRIESGGSTLLRRVTKGYADLAGAREMQPAVLVPASGTKDDVTRRLRIELLRRFFDTGMPRATGRDSLSRPSAGVLKTLAKGR